MAVFLAAVHGYAGVRMDLPELVGEYSLGGEEPWLIPSARTTYFTLPDSIESIEGLRVTASGPWYSGLRLQCRDVGGIVVCDTIPWVVQLAFRLTSATIPDGYFYAEGWTSNSVELNEELVPGGESGDLDINLLLGVEIRAELYCDVPADEIWQYVEASHGELLVVAIETVGAVPVRSTSWAGVKALFR